MARQVDFPGKSGAAYRYTRLEEGHPLWPSGGNYVYVREGQGGLEVVYAGEAESLFRGYHEHWERAREDHGATDIYIRLNVSGSVRRAEQADIAAGHQPLMNGPDTAVADKPKRTSRKKRA